MRSAAAIIQIVITAALMYPSTAKADVTAIRDTIVVYHKDTVYYLPAGKRRAPLGAGIRYPKIDSLRKPALAFRSNLLLPLLNVGAECPVSNRWSVAADFYYPWCPREWINRWSDSQMNCLQALGGYLEGRYWFGSQHRSSESACGKYRLLGHSLGLIAGAAYYDVERGGAGQQGEIYTIGIGYTYALPLGKKGGIHLEFAIAAGAVYRKWHPYSVHETGGYLLRGKDENGIGISSLSKWSLHPIKAGVSLAVPIFIRKSLNAGSHGRR